MTDKRGPPFLVPQFSELRSDRQRRARLLRKQRRSRKAGQLPLWSREERAYANDSTAVETEVGR